MTADRAADLVSPVLVTGATGTIGRHVVAGLLAAGRSVRAAVPRPERAGAGLGAGVACVRFPFTDPSTWAGAFDGVQVMFLMRPPQLSNIERDMVPALQAARDAGVIHVVLLSLQGAESNRVVPHAKIEAWLRGNGLGWTFVRPSFFMENLAGTHISDIRDRDEILVPAGRGATSFIAARDVAAVALAALLDPPAHLGRAWTPTGDTALTYTEVAEVLTGVLGRTISYRCPGLIRYARHARQALGMLWGMVRRDRRHLHRGALRARRRRRHRRRARRDQTLQPRLKTWPSSTRTYGPVRNTITSSTTPVPSECLERPRHIPMRSL